MKKEQSKEIAKQERSKEIVLNEKGQPIKPETEKFRAVVKLLKYKKYDDLAVLLGRDEKYKTTLAGIIKDKSPRDVPGRFIRELELWFNVDFTNSSAEDIAASIQPEYFENRDIIGPSRIDELVERIAAMETVIKRQTTKIKYIETQLGTLTNISTNTYNNTVSTIELVKTIHDIAIQNQTPTIEVKSISEE
ncbi:MAG: hypothetical protein ACPGXZ_00705 [Saprospiraceae bacterium]